MPGFRRRQRQRLRPRRQFPTTTTLATLLILPLLILLLSNNTNTHLLPVFVNAQSDDYYCGLDWSHAADTCPETCPSGRDNECVTKLGDANWGCFFFTGCAERVANGDFGAVKPETTPAPTPADNDGGEEVVEFPTFSPSPPPTEIVHTAFCAESWLQASLNCNEDADTPATPCPNGGADECLPRENCYKSLQCSLPLVEIESELIFTLDGVSSTMDGNDETIFTSTIFELLSRTLEESKVSLTSIKLMEQQMGYSFDYIDITLLITVTYRPQPSSTDATPNIYDMTQEYINTQSRQVIAKLKIKGMGSSSSYYDDADGIGVGIGRTREPTETPTMYPTGKPSTRKPSGKPTPPPTGKPTTFPTNFPSAMPSTSPSRAHFQSLASAETSSLLSLGTTNAAYGFLFNVRTTPESPAILFTGMEFYTGKWSEVNYELWSRLGSYEGYKGTYEGWDLVASGTVEGKGGGKYISIPEEEFTEVSISGGGSQDDDSGTRAFYLTLNTKDLMFKETASGEDSSDSDTRSHASSPELEIYEGEAILSYPFPPPSKDYFYRAPREFVGVLHYNRLPCKPFSMYGPVMELPCPTDGFPTKRPSTELPTGNPAALEPTASPISTALMTDKPVTSSVEALTPAPVNSVGTIDGEDEGETEKPTPSPIRLPTLSPTKSYSPTLSLPPTNKPTPSPVVPIHANIVMTLRDINSYGVLMNKAEVNAFNYMLIAFLNLHTGDRMVVISVGMWNMQFLLVDEYTDSNGEGVLTATARQQPVARGALEQETRQKQKSLEERKEKIVPQVSALELTLILSISHTTLPHEMLSNMAVVTIEENQGDLLGRLGGLSGPYPYFANITGIDVYSIDILERSADTPAPTSVAKLLESESEKDSKGSSAKVGLIVGLIVGLFWLCLASIGILFLRRARSRMTYLKDSESLRHLEQDPIKHDPTLLGTEPSEPSSRTIPLGGDWADMDIDESSRTGRSKKSGVSKSYTSGRAMFKVVDDNGARLNSSDVITAKEKEAIDKRALMIQQRIQDSVALALTSGQVGGVKGGKAALGKSMGAVDWDKYELDDGYNDAPVRRKANTNRRGLLTRSDSQIEFDSSLLNDSTHRRKSTDDIVAGRGELKSSLARSNGPQNNLRKSAILRNSTTLRNSGNLDGYDDAPVRRKANANRRVLLTRSDSQIQFDSSLLNDSTHRRKSTDDIVAGRGELKSSLARSNGPQNNLRKSAILRNSTTLRNSSKLRKMTVDLEFENALLDDDNPESDVERTPPRAIKVVNTNVQSSLTRSRTQANNIRSSLARSNTSANHNSSFSSNNSNNNRSSLARPNSRGNLRSSIARPNSQDNLRKSRADIEFEDALLKDDDDMGQGKSIDLRASLRKSTTRPPTAFSRSMLSSNNIDYGDLLDDKKLSFTKKRVAQKSGMSQSMLPKKSDYGDLLDGENGQKLKSSLTKKRPPKALSRSAKVSKSKNSDLLRESATKKTQAKDDSSSSSSSSSSSDESTVIKKRKKKDVGGGKVVRSSNEGNDGKSKRNTKKKSGENRAASLRKSGTKGGNRGVELGSRDDTTNHRNIGRRKLSGDDMMSQSDTKPRTKPSQRPNTKGNSDDLERSDREGKDDSTKRKTGRQKPTVDNSKPLSRSDTTGSVRKSGTNGSNIGALDKSDRGGRDGTKRAGRRGSNNGLSQSVTIPRNNVGNRASLRNSGKKNGSDDLQRLVVEARVQTGDTSQPRLTRKKVVSRTNGGEMSALRRSARRDGLDNLTRRGEETPPRAAPRTTPRSINFDDPQTLDHSGTTRSPADGRGLSKSMRVTAKNGYESSENLTEVRQSSKKRSDEGPTSGNSRSIKRSGNKSKGTSELRHSMIV